jgi:GH24 family phage-related lysozyme (muramidase)
MQHILDVQFPEENPQGAPGGDFQHIESSPAMFGGLRAQALQTFGGGLEKAGNTAVDIATQQNELQNKVHAADVKSWYADQTTDLHTRFTGLSGRAAQDALPDYKQKMLDLKGQALDQVPSPTMKAALNESLTSMQDQYWRYWSGHAGQQIKTYADKVAQDSIASSSALAVNSLLAGDEVGFERRLREQDAEVHNFYDGQGYALDQMDSEVQKRRGVTLKTAIETVAAGGDVAKAQALFDKYRNRMDPQSVLQVTANLRSGVAQINGRGVAEEESGYAQPKADSVAGIPSSFVAQIKRSEGFAPTASWDVKQFSNGYGTRAKFEGEIIDRAEADKRFGAAIDGAAKVVDKVNPNLDPGTRAALTSLTYETGDDWTRSGLGDAIRAGDLDKAKQIFVQYNKVAGQTNEGVANRRFREAQWFGGSEAPPSSGPLVDKQRAYERVLARTDNNPLEQTAAIARLNQVYSIYHAEQASQNAGFDLRLKDSTAEALATGSAKNPLNEADFVNRYGASEGQRRYAGYTRDLALGADVAGLAEMSADDQGKLLQRYTPAAGSEGFEAQQDRQTQIAKAIAHVQKERDADPAAFAIRRLPAVRGAFKAFSDAVADPSATPQSRQAAAAHYAEVTLAEQARVGVAPADRRVLPQGLLEQMNGKMTAAASSDDPKARVAVVGMVKQEAATWGDRWPDVMRQLAPSVQPVVRAIAAGADETAMARLLSVDPKEKPSVVLKEQNAVKANEVTSAVNSEMAPFLATMVGRQRDRDYGSYLGLANELAALYVRDGKDASTAAHDAFNALIGNRYDFRDTYRIPKDAAYSADDVQRGAQSLRQGLGKIGAVPPVDDIPGRSDSAPAEDLAKLGRDAVWVTSPRNDGLNLVYGDKWVRSGDGQPLFVPWAVLSAAGKQASAARAEAAPDTAMLP